jgi:hypothetical protein
VPQWSQRRRLKANVFKGLYSLMLGWHKNRLYTKKAQKIELPATTASFFMVLLTIIMASCKDLSVSSINCSAPPRSIMVHVLA